MEKNIQNTVEGAENALNEEIMKEKIDKALALLEEWMRDIEMKYEIE